MALKLSPEFLNKQNVLMTNREQMELIRHVVREVIKELNDNSEPAKLEIKGIIGLAEFLKTSTTTAQKIKKSGKIPFVQFGKAVYFDGNKVLKALEK